jgi:hypothetical protein
MLTDRRPRSTSTTTPLDLVAIPATLSDFPLATVQKVSTDRSSQRDTDKGEAIWLSVASTLSEGSI